MLTGTTFSASAPRRGLPKVEDGTRVAHARELLGSSYERSIVKKAESVEALQSFILQHIARRLPETRKHEAWEVAKTVIDESKRHGMDPLFVLAVAEHESKFNPDAVGSFGEIGLMQIRPTTGEWIAPKLGLQWQGAQSLRDMRTNIRLGVGYMAFLRSRLRSHAAHYLTAYNMGAANLRRALAGNVQPREYSSKVMREYLGLYTQIAISLKSGLDEGRVAVQL